MFITALLLSMFTASAEIQPADVRDYLSLQAAVEANPGTVLHVPAGVHGIDGPLRFTTPGSGLYGPGRIVQTNPEADIIEIADTEDVRIEGVTLTRPEGKQETHRHAINAHNSNRVVVRDVRVIDNRSNAGTIMFERCHNSVASGCEVLNYKRIAVDDRTASDLYGYAFRVIDGTGILVTYSSGIQILNNRVVETSLFATQETKSAHQLGQFTDGRLPMTRGPLAPKGDYANNWHQGSAIVVTSPEDTHHVLVSGNYIENAAQGIDIHADQVTCTNNVIDHAFLGIKCMHGSRNVIISQNNVSHCDLWGLVMMPGTASHPGVPASGDVEAKAGNYTRGNIISNNIFSDIGRGYEGFNWPLESRRVISLESGQLAENPVMTGVLIEGNIVYDSAADGEIVDGRLTAAGPRYRYAVLISTDPRPEGLVFRNNIFHPGTDGIANIPLEEFE